MVEILGCPEEKTQQRKVLKSRHTGLLLALPGTMARMVQGGGRREGGKEGSPRPPVFICL
jgi:hypothetical protein